MTVHQYPKRTDAVGGDFEGQLRRLRTTTLRQSNCGIGNPIHMQDEIRYFQRLVGNRDRVSVAQRAVSFDNEYRSAIMLHEQLLSRTKYQGHDHGRTDEHQHGRIDRRARPKQPQRLRLSGSLGGLARQRVPCDQSFRLTGFLHDLVAGIDAKTAIEALKLNAVADIDAGWAGLHAGTAIYTVAQSSLRGMGGIPLAMTTRLPSPALICDGEGLLIQHC